MADVKFQHVPYRGSVQVVTDLIGKRLDFMVDPPTLIANLASEHALRALPLCVFHCDVVRMTVRSMIVAVCWGAAAQDWQNLYKKGTKGRDAE